MRGNIGVRSTEVTADLSAEIEAAENDTEAEKVEKDTHCVTDVRITEKMYSLATTQNLPQAYKVQRLG